MLISSLGNDSFIYKNACDYQNKQELFYSSDAAPAFLEAETVQMTCRTSKGWHTAPRALNVPVNPFQIFQKKWGNRGVNNKSDHN